MKTLDYIFIVILVTAGMALVSMIPFFIAYIIEPSELHKTCIYVAVIIGGGCGMVGSGGSLLIVHFLTKKV